MSDDLLEYRAGPSAIAALRRNGWSSGVVRVVALPATGPRWLIATGFDEALRASGCLTSGPRRSLLVGASAGAWRALALASRDPSRTYAALIEAYVGKVFRKGTPPEAVSASYRETLERLFGPEVTQLVDPPSLDVVVVAARHRVPWTPARAERPWTLGLSVLAASMGALLRAGAGSRWFERVAFHSRRADPALLAALPGRHVPLREANVLFAALASGSVPFAMTPVHDLEGAGVGRYVDGGFTDYHLNAAYPVAPDGVVVLFSHDARIVPTWFDKRRSWRAADRAMTDAVLHVRPSPRFVASLPGGRVPDREDFYRFIDAPEQRIARWREACRRSEALGEAWLNDLASGRFFDALVPLT